MIQVHFGRCWNRRDEEGYTGARRANVCGSKTWSEGSLVGRESREERNDLVNDSSVMVGYGSEIGAKRIAVGV